MKKYLLLIVFAAITGMVNAQQDPQFTNWMFDRISFNPAAAGMDRLHCLTVFHRDQWDGFAGDPKTYLLNYNGYVQTGYNKSQLIGIGLSAYTEVLGKETNNVVRLAGAYHKNLGASTLSVGLHLGMVNKSLGAKWNPIDQGDATIPTGGVSSMALDANLGVMLYQPGKYYAGLSATHLPAANLYNVNVKLARHYYLMGGYEYPIDGSDIKLRANALVKTSLKSKMSADINVNALWNDMVWGGLSFRPGDAIAPMLGFQTCKTSQVNKTTEMTNCFKIGYSYDVTTSDIKDYSAGSHEIFVSACLGINKLPLRMKYSNPRFL